MLMAVDIKSSYQRRSKLPQRDCIAACWELHFRGCVRSAPLSFPQAFAHLSARLKRVKSSKIINNVYQNLVPQVPGTPGQRWRCCQLQLLAPRKARPVQWSVMRGSQPRNRSPRRTEQHSWPPGSRPAQPETWSPPAAQRDKPADTQLACWISLGLMHFAA